MNRRSFLLFTGAFASSVIVRPRLGAIPLKTATPVIQDVPPRLWGDGIHDDSPWLQWMIDHNNYIDLAGGRYTLFDSLHVRENTKAIIANGWFEWNGPRDQATIVYDFTPKTYLALT